MIFMDEILFDIDSAFKMISSIPVSGDAVDMVAVARAKLRNVYAKLEEMRTENKEEGEKQDG